LDYQYTEKNFKVGDEVNIKSVIVNPSDKSYNQYPKKSRHFFLANEKE
jgi:ribosomal protein L19